MKWARAQLSNLLARVAMLLPFLSRVMNTDDPASFGRFGSLISLILVLLMNVVYMVVGVIAFFMHRIEIHEIVPTAGIFMSETGFALAFFTASKGLDVWKSNGSQNTDKNVKP